MCRFQHASFSVLFLLIASIAIATDTGRVGGSGGTSTVTMDCGSNAFIVGINASGGRDGAFGFNLVRKIKFTCARASGSSVNEWSTTSTPEAAGSKAATANTSSSNVTCPTNYVVNSVNLFAGDYIDRLAYFNCKNGSGTQSRVDMNVGGDGGTSKGLNCPASEGLFKVVAKVGDTIDSLTGSCRQFPVPETVSIKDQINGSFTPKPTSSNPLKIMPEANASISFAITAPDTTAPHGVGIEAHTDFLGGGSLNLPDYKMEALNPSGQVVATSTVKNNKVTKHGIFVSFNVAGKWKLRITNLKKDIGALDVTYFHGH